MTAGIIKRPQEEQTNQKAKKVPKLSLFKTKEEKGAGDYLRNYTLEILAIFFWVYTIAKVFIFDIDSWVLGTYLPSYEWLLNFKLLYILALASVLWLWIGTRDAFVWFLYIIFYPFVILIKISLFIFKQESWLLAFAMINAVASFFTNLKYSLIFTTIFLAAFSIAALAQADYFLVSSITVLAILILVAYVKNFMSALRPTTIFRIYSKFFREIRKIGYSSSFALDVKIKNLPIEQLEPEQLEKWHTSLQTSVVYNRLCLFVATRLQDYQRSEWRIIPSIFGLLWLIVFTVVSFSGIYYSLFKIDTNLFKFTEEPTLFTFLYFSFNNLILNSTLEISPSMALSQSVYMSQAALSFLVIILMATLYISHRVQKSAREIDGVITEVEAEARGIEDFIQKEYKISDIETATKRLEEVKSGLIGFIYWLSKGIR